MSQYTESSKIISTYHALVMKNLDRIMDAWNADNYSEAVWHCIILAYTLPPDHFGKIKDETEKLIAALNLAESVRGGNFHTTNVWRGQAGQGVAFRNLPEYYQKLIQVLDEGGYLKEPLGSAIYPAASLPTDAESPSTKAIPTRLPARP